MTSTPDNAQTAADQLAAAAEDAPATDAPPQEAADQGSAEQAPAAEDVEPADAAAEDPAQEGTRVPVPEGTVLLVRRQRTPTLGFWVLVAMVVAAVVGIVVAVATGVDYLSGILYFAVTSAVFIGLPLAAIAALVDALRHRRSDRRR